MKRLPIPVALGVFLLFLCNLLLSPNAQEAPADGGKREAPVDPSPLVPVAVDIDAKAKAVLVSVPVRELVELDVVEGQDPELASYEYYATGPNGQALAGVQVTMDIGGKGKRPLYKGTTGQDGRCTLRMPPGEYYVHDWHPHCVEHHDGETQAGSFSFPVPGIRRTRTWKPIYVYGVRIIGGRHDATMWPTYGFSRSERINERFTDSVGTALREHRKRMRDRFGSGVELITIPVPGDEVRMRICDRNKGVHEFSVPVVKLRDFRGPLVIDMNGLEMGEAMAWVEVKLVGADGAELDAGRLWIEAVLTEAQGDLFDAQETRVLAGQPSYLPAGKYRILPPKWTRDHGCEDVVIELKPGEGRVVAFELPQKLYPVVIKVSAVMRVRLESADSAGAGAGLGWKGKKLFVPGLADTLMLPAGDLKLVWEMEVKAGAPKGAVGEQAFTVEEASGTQQVMIMGK